MLGNFTKLRRAALDEMLAYGKLPQGEAQFAAIKLTVAALANRTYASFILPENGEVVKFDTQVVLPVSEMRLPFPRVALEFTYSPGYFGNMTAEKNWAPSACILFAEQLEDEQQIRGWCVWRHNHMPGGSVGWTPSIHGFRFPNEGRIEVASDGGVRMFGMGIMIAHQKYLAKDDAEEQSFLMDFVDELRVLAHFASVANCENVSPVKVYEPSEKLVKRCKERSKPPPDEYYVLDCYFNPAERGGAGTGTHESPRLHLRRGHIRRLPTGKTTWVRQCIVGNPERGTVEKDYRVCTGPERGPVL